MKKRIISSLLVVGMMLPVSSAFADYDHTIVKGDTMWGIANKNGITLQELREANNKWDNKVKIGDKLVIPSIVTNEEKDLMARLVYAEARGESYEGKVAVAEVVLNRVDAKGFPNTVSEVVNYVNPRTGYYAFTPVQNGKIKNDADEDSTKAVYEALKNRNKNKTNGALYFSNIKKISTDWILTREQLFVIGNHTFFK